MQKTKKRVMGTKEWAKYSRNLQDGCEHDCRYCYAKAIAIQYKRATPESWAKPKIRDKTFPITKLTGRIMFPTTHDITPFNIEPCARALVQMVERGNKVLIVSKPHFDCIVRLVRELEPWKKQVMFRFTIGSQFDSVLGYWEPSAPKFGERFDCLRLAFLAGYATSVSCEPLLEGTVDEARMLVAALAPFVTDSIWIGRANNLARRVAMNCPKEEVYRTASLVYSWRDEKVKELYEALKGESVMKWKDSIKAVVGIKGQKEAGMDI